MTEKKIYNVLSENGTLHFDFMTSLQNIAMAKIINHLWMNQDIQEEIVGLNHRDSRPQQKQFSGRWQQLENIISTKVLDLCLPKSISTKLMNVVPVVGNSLHDWIAYHEKILNTAACSKNFAKDLISNIAWTARGKVDYTQTAKNILANKDSCLSYDHKYKLACTYCLETEIVSLAVNVVNEHYLDNVQIRIHPMVYFWTSYITSDNTKLNNCYHEYNRNDHGIDNNISIDNYILHLLINDVMLFRVVNEVPIKFMWDKLSEEEKAKNIKFLVRNLSNQELRYILLSNLNYEQQEDVFKSYGVIILNDILNDWIWSDYFLPITLYVLDIVSVEWHLNYFYLFEEINKAMTKNFEMENYCVYDQFKYYFKEIWQKSSRHYTDSLYFLLVIELGIKSLSWDRDMDLIVFMFNNLNEQQKRQFFLEHYSIRHFTQLIINDKLHLLELFIKSTCPSEEDIFILKQRLAEEKEIAHHFLEEETLHKIEHFISWAFNSENKIREFRKSLAYIKCQVVIKSLISNKNLDFMKLDNHYNWCAKGDLELIKQFKSESPKLYAEELVKLIQEGKYELLDQFLNWCFLNNQQTIIHFKCNMYKVIIPGFVNSIVYDLIISDNSFKMLDKFIDWCFNNEQEVQEFKTWLLYYSEGNYSVCRLLLTRQQLTIADKFINWCCNCSEAVTAFKNAFSLSIDMNIIIYFVCLTAQNNYFQSLIKWLKPSKETVEKLKNMISEYCLGSRYEWLDEFGKSQTF